RRDRSAARRRRLRPVEGHRLTGLAGVRTTGIRVQRRRRRGTVSLQLQRRAWLAPDLDDDLVDARTHGDSPLNGGDDGEIVGTDDDLAVERDDAARHAVIRDAQRVRPRGTIDAE